ncbi:hypothetical protein [Yoonia litorea]|uniref:Domain of unknwon function n=1 Tax=Yoonia litorea TaxID=1123755 RepID=A0A1I6MWP4_9RHOB|nr:hypothetical protein [Yoonia litorea]SFS20122.1 hypothetical protein SAMN05444714_2485 [Yoonia litorea]
MWNKITAAITAMSFSLATVVPASAEGFDREDIGKLLLGLAAIAAVNAAIENNQRREDRTQADERTSRSANSGRHDWADLNRPRPRGERHADVLPSQCLRTVETRFGNLRLFGQRCLERNYRFAERLPQRCEVRVYSDHGPRSGYDPFCLREHGYRTNRRH